MSETVCFLAEREILPGAEAAEERPRQPREVLEVGLSQDRDKIAEWFPKNHHQASEGCVW